MTIETQSNDLDREANRRFRLFLVAELLCTGAVIAWVVLW